MAMAIGLDFGTTNSVVSYVDAAGKLRTFKQNGSPLIPSAIYFKTKDEYVTGQAALSLGEKNPNRKISGFKMRLSDRRDQIVYEDGRLKPKVAVKLFLNRLMAQVQEYLIKKFGAAEGTIDRAVITVPAKFNDAANRAIKLAAAAAMNLSENQIRLVYEPTAAAVAAQRENISGASNFLIYDFGGGTFDVSLIQKARGIFHQILTDGDPNCGGDLLTDILAQYFLKLANESFGTNFPWDAEDFDEDFHGVDEIQYARNRAAILREAARVKTSLSGEKNFTATFPFYVDRNTSREFVTEITRADFEKLIRKIIERTAEITQRVIDSEAAENIGGVEKIILAGGSSQIPLVREILRAAFKSFDVSYSEDVSTLISRGAAILAQDIESVENLTSQKTTAQIGVASTEGLMYNIFQPVIDADTKLPCENSCEFKLLEDGQRHLEIAYYERDAKNFPNARRIDDDGVNLVDVLQIDLPAGLKKNSTVVKINFSVHSDSSVEISAAVTANGEDIGGGAVEVRRASDLF